jgi:hypothetical protein
LNAFVDDLLLAGWKKQTVAGLIKTMDERLKRDPLGFGNPLYTLRATHIKIHVGFVRPFSFQFGVHEESKSVFVRRLVLMTTERPV